METLPLDVFLRTAWIGLMVNLGVAIGEETIFRGYLLIGLKAAWGKRQALIIMTLIFGLFHLPAYMGNGMGSLTLMLAILLASHQPSLRLEFWRERYTQFGCQSHHPEPDRRIDAASKSTKNS